MAGLHIGGAANQSNGVGFASSKASGGATANANAPDSRAYAAISSCRYAQMTNDAPSANAGTTQTWNVNTGDEDLQPYRASGNDISAIYGVGYLLKKHGLCTDAAFSQAGIAASSIPIHWAKAAAWGTINPQVVSFWTARAAAIGRNYDYGIHQIGETDSGTPARVISAQADILSFYNILAVDCPSTANMKTILVLLNAQQTTGGSDIAGYNAQLLALAAAYPSRFLIVDPGTTIAVPSDPHYRADGYWRLSERIVHAIRQDRYSGITLDLSAGPAPWVQGESPLASVVNNLFPLNINGPYMGLGELPGRHTQLGVAATYFAQSLHTLTTPAGFVAAVPTIDSTFTTLHHQLTVWQRPVVRASLITDSAGGKYLPQASITITDPTGTAIGATLDLARTISVGGADPNDPIVGYFTGTPGTNATTLPMATSSAGNPMTVPPNCTAVAIIGTNGATQTLASLANASTGAWTIHRDSIGNPGAGTVGIAHASAQITGTSIGTTTATMGTAGVNVGAVVVFRPDGTKAGAIQNAGTSMTGTISENVAGGDTTKPTITIVSPTPGVTPGQPGGFPADLATALRTPIVLDVTDIGSGIQYLVVVARFAGAAAEEVVYRRGAFRGAYVGTSTATAITGGLRLSVLPSTGWKASSAISAISFDVDVIDAAGNLAN